MSKDKILITISGLDKVGIVAGISHTLAQLNVNIEDIKQTIMQDHFVMMMLCNISNSKESFSTIKDKLEETAKSLHMTIWVQRKEIFDKMHTI